MRRERERAARERAERLVASEEDGHRQQLASAEARYEQAVSASQEQARMVASQLRVHRRASEQEARNAQARIAKLVGSACDIVAL